MTANLNCPTCSLDYELNDKIVGIEIRGLYDGVLFWKCPAGHYFHRWPPDSIYYKRANAYAQEFGYTIHD